MDKTKAKNKMRTPDAEVAYRSYQGVQEFRAITEDDAKKVEGHPAVFGKPADIGGWFQETIERGAFDGCDFTDVLLFVNHEQEKIPLARSRRNNGNSTMTLDVDDTGLHMVASLDTENNAEARAVFSSIERGDMDGMSFCFRVKEDKWDNVDSEYPTRHILKISKVYEVSAVNNPAYPDTDISARNDKAALDNARKAVETARSKEVETSIEVLKLKNEILSK